MAHHTCKKTQEIISPLKQKRGGDLFRIHTINKIKMTKKKIKTVYRTQRSYKRDPRDQEQNLEPSVTIQDDVLSIKELLQRHSAGINVPGNQVYYDDTEDFDAVDHNELRHADLVDKQELAEKLKIDLQEAEKQIKDKNQPKAETQPDLKESVGKEANEAAEIKPGEGANRSSEVDENNAPPPGENKAS